MLKQILDIFISITDRRVREVDSGVAILGHQMGLDLFGIDYIFVTTNALLSYNYWIFMLVS
jgi:hypothetical protein